VKKTKKSVGRHTDGIAGSRLVNPYSTSSKAKNEKGWKFQPISASRAYQEVVDQITYAIRSGAFSRDERLPVIEDLARKMRVSRPTIGEAVRLLSKAGVVEPIRGLYGGIRVASDQIPKYIISLTSALSDSKLSELIEARRAIEPSIALLAAKHSTEEDFEEMERTIKQLEDHAEDDYTIRIHYDHLFHYAMGRAAKSRVLARYQHEILEQLFLRMRGDFAEFEDVGTVVALHRDTLHALRTRDPEQVGCIMDRHLKYIEEWGAKPEQSTLRRKRDRREFHE
jgi:DNA-binding FadR family transcriptional regulator